jgi:uncharacterized protein
MIEFGVIFLTGLLASAHCVGMCGPIVLAYATQKGPDGLPVRSWWMHAAYNGGRIASYAALGIAVGFLGTMVSNLDTWASALSIGGGVVMILAGLVMLNLFPLPAIATSSPFVRTVHARLLLRPTLGSKLALGLLTPFLPCGMLYAMVGKAAASGSAMAGGLTMAVFGAGMAPGLFALGGMSSLLSATMRRGAERLAALAVIFLGVVLLLRGLHIPFLSGVFTAPVGGHHSCCQDE